MTAMSKRAKSARAEPSSRRRAAKSPRQPADRQTPLQRNWPLLVISGVLFGIWLAFLIYVSLYAS